MYQFNGSTDWAGSSAWVWPSTRSSTTFASTARASATTWGKTHSASREPSNGTRIGSSTGHLLAGFDAGHDTERDYRKAPTTTPARIGILQNPSLRFKKDSR